MFTVAPLSKIDCQPFVINDHYLHRMPIFWYGFGLFECGKLVGCVVYGQPSPPLQKHAFESRDFAFLELSRLVVTTKTKNAASFLISNSMKLLKKPCAIVSFADTAMGHSGIVYQATNWLYTGATTSHSREYFVNGKWVSEISLGVKNPVSWSKENGINSRKPMQKHRYFTFVGNRKERHMMRKLLKYSVIDAYPKSDKVMYNIPESITII